MRNSLLILSGVCLGLMLLSTLGSQYLFAAPLTLDIKKAKDPGPGFGDEKLGTVTLNTQGNKIDLSANLTAQPKQDKVFEGWLVDTPSNYKMSVGAVNNGQLTYSANLVNPYTFSQFIITEEPKDDKDPNAAGTYGGTDLPPPFNQ